MPPNPDMCVEMVRERKLKIKTSLYTTLIYKTELHQRLLAWLGLLTSWLVKWVSPLQEL